MGLCISSHDLRLTPSWLGLPPVGESVRSAPLLCEIVRISLRQSKTGVSGVVDLSNTLYKSYDPYMDMTLCRCAVRLRAPFDREMGQTLPRLEESRLDST
jgi:hypothetical protein